MIRFEGVTKSYGRKTAVSDLSLEVAPGEVFAFLGPNGAGKTTAIKLLVGLLRPDRGRVWLGSVDVVQSPREASRQTGYVPDEPYLYDKLTGREFLEFIAGMYAMPRDEAVGSIDEQISTFGLEPFVDRLAETYSHGMKQRLVFAAALVHRPSLLVLDEPMVGLDPLSMRLVKDLLRRQSRQGTTVFMSTHTLPLAEEIADRIGVIHQARLQFVGTVQQLKQHGGQEGHSLEDLFLRLTNDRSDGNRDELRDGPGRGGWS